MFSKRFCHLWRVSFLAILFCASSLSAFLSCSGESLPEPEIIDTHDSTTVFDFEGNIYKTVRIGNQVWMAENMKTQFTASGNQLNGIYVYDNNNDNVNEYGRLYTWESAINASPEGWHLPSDTEWNELISVLGSHAGDKLKVGGSSTFNAKMAGVRHTDGFFLGIESIGSYWTSSESGDHAATILVVLNEPDVVTGDNTLKTTSISVRYIKD